MTDAIRINGRVVEPGTELSITGEQGRFVFRWTHRNGDITVWGGRVGHESMRSFRRSAVRRVHYKTRTRRNEAA